MSRSWRSWLTWIAVTLVTAGGLYYLFSKPPVPVDTMLIERGHLEVTVEDEGVTRIREVYTVSAPVSGRVLRSPREVGDTVTKGVTLLASIEPTAPSFLDERARKTALARVQAAKAALRFAEATVRKAEAELEFAKSDLARAKRLATRDFISERALDEAKLKVSTLEAALETAKAEVEVKRQELDSAQAQLIQPTTNLERRSPQCCVQVMAPENGRVLKVLAESEKVVTSGTPLIEIGDPKDLEIIVDLLSTDAVRVKPGAKAYIERWGGDKTLLARVNYVEPAGFKDVSALGIEEQRVNVRLDFQDPPQAWAALGHDYRVFVRIVIWESDDAIRMPLSALFRKGDEWAVFKVIEGRATLQIIRIGQRNQRYAQVTEGLDPGDRVILHPSDRITEGVQVVERAELK